jgi:hypothetical protein
MEKVTLLLRSTIRLYLTSFIDAWQGVRRNWYWGFLPLLYVPVFAIGARVVMLLPLGIISGLLLGLLGALVFANYLALLSFAVRGEKMLWREVWPETLTLFSPVLGALFVLFGVQLITSFALKGQPLVVVAINLVIVTVFNPLPEVVYQQRGGALEAYGEALEFMKENAVEWLLLFLLLLSPLFLFTPLTVFGIFANTGPFDAIFVVLRSLTILSVYAPPVLILPSVLAALFAGFYLFSVRGVLFSKLHQTSRRKRIYDERMR